jgi:hypothetical protein
MAGGAQVKHPAGAVEIQMRNVNLRMEHDIVLQVRSVRGRLVPTGDSPVNLDDRNSFVLDIDNAVMAISTASLTELLNSYVFAYDGAPLKKLTVTAKEDGRLEQKGTMRKGVDLPFEMEGPVSATPDGNLRLHADKIKSEHLPFKGLLHLFGEDLSKLVNVNEARGVRIEDDDIFLYPSRTMPPPHIRGRIASVRVEGDNIVQVFEGRPAAPLRLPVAAANYIYHRGGLLRFGKLTMTDTDLEIIDANPQTPFDFSLLEYNRQLVAGYSKNTASHGLIVHMPDYGQLGR